MTADLGDEVVDQRRLERHPGDDLLDRLPVGCDPLGIVGLRGRRAPLVAQRLLETDDLTLQAPDSREGLEDGLELRGVDLATLR